MLYRLHFTDASLAQMAALGLDQDALRTVIHQGSKMQLGENHLVCRHRGAEVEVSTVGLDYEVLAVRREAVWPSKPSLLPYAVGLAGGVR